MKRFITKPRVAIAVVACAGLSAVGAYAYWTATGGGSGSASVTSPDSSSDLRVSNATVTGLYPGGTAAVSSDIVNPNAWRVKVGTISVGIRTSPTTCPAGDFRYTGDDGSAGSFAFNNFVAAASSARFSGRLTMADTDANQDACKGATVTLTYSIAPTT